MIQHYLESKTEFLRLARFTPKFKESHLMHSSAQTGKKLLELHPQMRFSILHVSFLSACHS